MVCRSEKGKRYPANMTIVGYFGFGNTGDEAILEVILSGLRSVAPFSDYTVFSGNPDSTAKLHKVKALYSSFLLSIKEAIVSFSIRDIASSFALLSRTIVAMRNTDLLVFAGGGLLQDTHGPGNILEFFEKVAIAKVFRKRVVLLAVGIDPMRSWVTKQLLRLILTQVDLITVRDSQSKTVLREFGFEFPSRVVLDPAFFLRPVGPEDAKKLLVEDGVNLCKRPMIGFCVRPWRAPLGRSWQGST